jgi:type IV fimbrial biogenesis protein FimT
MRHSPPPRRPHAGLTLIELLVVLIVIGLVVGAALPGFQAMLERRHLEGVAAQLETDIHFARSMAVAQQQPIRISYTADASGSGWVLHKGQPTHCRPLPEGRASCNRTATVVRSVHLPADAPVRLQANVATMVFDPLRGTTTPTGTLRVIVRGGAAVHQVVSLMGRVRSCTPTPGLNGYPRC